MNHKLNFAFLLPLVLGTLSIIACSMQDAIYRGPGYSGANPTPLYIYMETKTASLSEEVQLRLGNNRLDPRLISDLSTIVNVTQGALILQ